MSSFLINCSKYYTFKNIHFGFLSRVVFCNYEKIGSLKKWNFIYTHRITFLRRNYKHTILEAWKNKHRHLKILLSTGWTVYQQIFKIFSEREMEIEKQRAWELASVGVRECGERHTSLSDVLIRNLSWLLCKEYLLLIFGTIYCYKI